MQAFALSVTETNQVQVGTGSVSFHSEIPYGGNIDSFHNVKDQKLDDLSKAFYAFRHMKNVDLLRARKAYKEIYYSFNDINKVDSSHPQFEIPKNVYHVNNAKDHASMENIGTLVEQIKQNKPAQNNAKATKMIESLALVSSKIVEIDRYIKALTGDAFFDEEYGKSLSQNFRKRYFHGDLKPCFKINDFPERYGISQALMQASKRATKDFILNRADVKNKIMQLMATKDFLLNKYPLLSIKDKDDVPFYQNIYKSMEQKLGFPKANMAINLSKFNILEDKIEFEDDFGELMNLSLTKLKNSDWKQTLLHSLKGKFKNTIEKAVNNNTYWLEKLNKTIKYEDNLNPFFFLGMDEHNWINAKKSFPYIKDSVWVNAKLKFKKLLKEKEQNEKFKDDVLTYSSYALGAVGVISLFVPFVGPAIGVSILSASAGMVVANSFIKYRKSKEFAALSTKLFSATKESGNIYENEEYIEIEEQDLTNLMLSSVLSLTLARGPLGSLSGKFISVIGKAGAPVVRMTKKNYLKIKQSLAKNSSQTVLKSSLGKSLVGNSIKADHINPLLGHGYIKTQLKSSASKLNLSVKQLKEKFIKSDFYFKHFSAGNSKIFGRELSREMMVETGAMIYAEYLARGDKFQEELPFVVMNVLLAMGITSTIVSKNFRPLNSPANNNTSTRRMWDQGLNTGERARIWYRSGAEMAALTLPIMAVSSTGVEAWMYHQAIQNGEDPKISEHLTRAALNTIYTTLFLAVATTPRAQFVFKASERASASLSPTMARAVTFPLSTANNVSGSYVYSTMAQSLGIQSMNNNPDDAETEITESYISVEPNVNNSSYFFPELD